MSRNPVKSKKINVSDSEYVEQTVEAENCSKNSINGSASDRDVANATVDSQNWLDSFDRLVMSDNVRKNYCKPIYAIDPNDNANSSIEISIIEPCSSKGNLGSSTPKVAFQRSDSSKSKLRYVSKDLFESTSFESTANHPDKPQGENIGSVIEISDDEPPSEEGVDLMGSFQSLHLTSELTTETSNKETYNLMPGKWRRSIVKLRQTNNRNSNRQSNIKKHFECSLLPAAIEEVEELDDSCRLYSMLKLCNQQNIENIACVLSEKNFLNCYKIGEGVYSEVFMYTRHKKSFVFKLIPIAGSTVFNGEQQKSFAEIIPEIKMTEILSNLRNQLSNKTEGFVELESVKCFQGAFPKFLVNLWEKFDEERASENDHPSIFPNDQIYISFELLNCGQNLEAVILQSAEQGLTVLHQIILTLAVAEQFCHFEHRDLHWGNVLIKPVRNKYITFTINDETIKLETKGIKVTIIDYTLSRVNVDDCVLFNDLSEDDDLFTANGDYQFEIYRLMRNEVNNVWSNYHPKTNIFWCHYLASKLLKGVKYSTTTTRGHKRCYQILETLEPLILNYDSAYNLKSDSNLNALVI